MQVIVLTIPTSGIEDTNIRCHRLLFVLREWEMPMREPWSTVLFCVLIICDPSSHLLSEANQKWVTFPDRCLREFVIVVVLQLWFTSSLRKFLFYGDQENESNSPADKFQKAHSHEWATDFVRAELRASMRSVTLGSSSEIRECPRQTQILNLQVKFWQNFLPANRPHYCPKCLPLASSLHRTTINSSQSPIYHLPIRQQSHYNTIERGFGRSRNQSE